MDRMPQRRRRETEPTAADLRAIEAEWPMIAAELAIVEQEIRAARAGDGLDELSRRRMRRAASRHLRSVAPLAPTANQVDRPDRDDQDGFDFGGAA